MRGLKSNNSMNCKSVEGYRKEIIKILNKINNQGILNYIYIIVSDIAKEDEKNEGEK